MTQSKVSLNGGFRADVPSTRFSTFFSYGAAERNLAKTMDAVSNKRKAPCASVQIPKDVYEEIAFWFE